MANENSRYTTSPHPPGDGPPEAEEYRCSMLRLRTLVGASVVVYAILQLYIIYDLRFSMWNWTKLCYSLLGITSSPMLRQDAWFSRWRETPVALTLIAVIVVMLTLQFLDETWSSSARVFHQCIGTSLWLSGLLLPPVTHISSYLKPFSSSSSGLARLLQVHASTLSHIRYAISTVDVALLLSFYCAISITYFACIVPLCHIFPSTLLYNTSVPLLISGLCFTHCLLWSLTLIYLSHRAQVTKEMKFKHLWRQCSSEGVSNKTVSVYKQSGAYKPGDIVKISGDSVLYWQLTAPLRRIKHGNSNSAQSNSPPAAPLPAIVLRWHAAITSVFSMDACPLNASPLFRTVLSILFGHCTGLLIAALLLPHAYRCAVLCVALLDMYTVKTLQVNAASLEQENNSKKKNVSQENDPTDSAKEEFSVVSRFRSMLFAPSKQFFN